MTDTRERLESLAPRKRASYADAEGVPPGPHWPALVQSIGLLRFRHTLIPWARRKYGEPFSLRVLPEGRTIVLFHRPEHVKEIFAGDPQVFHAGKGNELLRPVMGDHSLLLVDGDTHHRARRMLTPAFSGKALRGYRGMVAELARDEAARWRSGDSFRSLERMNALTLEVILRVVFGVSDEARLVPLRRLVNRVVNTGPLVLLGGNFERLRRIGPWKRSVDTLVALDELLYAEIRERRAAGATERTDVLSRLLQVREEETGEGLSDAELRDQLVTLLLAGHETTATALSWALYELAGDPAQQERARAAALEGDDRYLEDVLKESMRLHPVIPMVVRQLMAPATIGGVDLPRGVTVAASIILAHQDPEQHPDAGRFRPERFGEGEVHPNAWIPFGGGVRRCIGAGFSLMEGAEVLRAVLTSYDVGRGGGPAERPRVRNITSVPRYGARISVTARR